MNKNEREREKNLNIINTSLEYIRKMEISGRKCPRKVMEHADYFIYRQ